MASSRSFDLGCKCHVLGESFTGCPGRFTGFLLWLEEAASQGFLSEVQLRAKIRASDVDRFIAVLSFHDRGDSRVFDFGGEVLGHAIHALK